MIKGKSVLRNLGAEVAKCTESSLEAVVDVGWLEKEEEKKEVKEVEEGGRVNGQASFDDL